MTTQIIQTLHSGSAAPTSETHCFPDREALGAVVIDGAITVQSIEPEQFYALADAALKTARDLDVARAEARTAAAHRACVNGLHGICDPSSHPLTKAG